MRHTTLFGGIFFVFMAIGVPCFIIGYTDEYVKDTAFCYKYKTSDGTCSAGKVAYACTYLDIYVRFPSNSTCSVDLGSYTNEKDAEHDGKSYLHDTLTIYKSTRTGECSLDSTPILLVGYIFLGLAGGTLCLCGICEGKLPPSGELPFEPTLPNV